MGERIHELVPLASCRVSHLSGMSINSFKSLSEGRCDAHSCLTEEFTVHIFRNGWSEPLK